MIVGAHPPTVTGLALALGFKTRQSLLNYQARSDKFNDIITEAVLEYPLIQLLRTKHLFFP